MQSLYAGDLHIDVEERSGMLLLRWKGKSTDRQPGAALDPFFMAVLAEALEKSASVEMRFEQLLHFNSSTISCLIQMIEDARAKSVRMLLTYNAKAAWQRLSFDALRVFAMNNSLLELRPVHDHESTTV